MSTSSSLLPVVCLMGPTAAGKTDLAMRWCEQQKFSFEIISVDSVMIYKGMDIGSGKPSAAELAQFPHKLVDILEPEVPYSAGTFHQDAISLIQAAHHEEKIPLLVGGTMLYFNTLFSGIDPLPTANPTIRAQITAKASASSWAQLHQELSVIDKIAADKINPNDAQRIQRALEVFYITQKPLSSFWKSQSSQVHSDNSHRADLLANLDLIKIALNPERPLLHQRIEQRFLKMLELGLIEETQSLLQKLSTLMDKSDYLNLPAMRSIGYRQVADYLGANVSYEDMVKCAFAATRQLAKRQVTWLRRWDDVVWCDPLEDASVRKLEANLFSKLDR